jgi:hypothetical protein
MNYTKSILSIFIILITTSILFAQNNEQWITYLDQDNLSIEYKYEDCKMEAGPEMNYVFLKFTNKTTENVSVIWDTEIYYNNICKTCGYDEHHFVLNLTPKESLAGHCSSSSPDELEIFSSFTNEAFKTKENSVSKFELANINVVQFKKK